MSHTQRRYLESTVLLFSVCCFPVAVLGEPSNTAEYTFTLRDGLQVSGEVDVLSDHDRLWIRRTADGVEIVSGIRWAEVVAVENEEGTHNIADFKGKLNTLSSAGAVVNDPKVNVTGRPTAPRNSRLEALVIHAELAQWDDDVQPDGLRVFVSPLDDGGRPISARGNIELTLFGETDWPNVRQRPRFVELERITHRLRPEDFSDGAAVLRLPFDKFAPDFSAEIAPVGLVHARLAIAGRGAFEASDANVCLRLPFEFRDQLQLHYGQRFLKAESGGNANRSKSW